MSEADTVAATMAVLPPGAHVGGRRLDRLAHRRADEQWLAGAWVGARVLIVDDGRVPVRGRPPTLVLRESADAPEGERYFLGVDAEGTAYFAVVATWAASGFDDAADIRLVTLREVGRDLDERDADLLVTAVALVNWHARHLYSPRSGLPTVAGAGGWTRVADGGETLWPRTDPAVIVLVHDGVAGPEGRCLLGHNTAWTGPGWARRYSCLAGFVEPGESAEATVLREVAEEVGAAVSGIRYVASQAWPFPGSLMLGFLAVADPTRPLRPDPTEISDARWFTRSEISAVLDGRRDDFGLPMAASIANYLVCTWLSGEAPSGDALPAGS
jgi:NAD+ diphosphatase